MEKEFVPYELALKLKELGFDEECFGWWSWINGITASLYTYPMKNSDIASHFMHPNNTSAPLWQQCFDWFRKIGYDTSISRTPPEMVGKGKIKKYSYFIWKEDDNPRGNQGFEDTYEEAREKCLEKLIEIVSNKIEK